MEMLKQSTPTKKQAPKNDASPKDPMIHHPVIRPPFFFPHNLSLGFITTKCIRPEWLAKPKSRCDR
jgi:hypothetical protein